MSTADSVFAKERADLVLLGAPDSSGVPVQERRDDIAEQHVSQDYRLVPAAELREAAEALRQAGEQYGELLARFGEFQAGVPEQFWPEDFRAAKRLMDGE